MFLASLVKRDKNYEIRLLWYFSILYIRHINDQLFLFLSYFFVCFPTLFLLFLKLQSYFYPTFLHMPARKPVYITGTYDITKFLMQFLLHSLVTVIPRFLNDIFFHSITKCYYIVR
jgi:hypothetical protein